MAKDNKTLHLVLKRKWWDMIASGEKKEEYRSQSDYWIKRLIEGQYYGSEALDRYKPYENVCFHLGYTNVTMMFKILSISINIGKSEWGAEQNKEYFVLKLGERIK